MLSPEIPHGGTLVGSINVRDVREAASLLTQARLVRVNRSTDEIEPWLAESWTSASAQASADKSASAPVSADKNGAGLSYTIKLRPNVQWSSGTPFTSDDVVFALESADLPVRVMGKPLVVRALGPLEVEVTLPSPFAPGLRLLDGVPIISRRSDREALGPFVMTNELTFERNPHYWHKAPDGQPLPYLDGLVLKTGRDQSGDVQMLFGGQLDLLDHEMRPDNYTILRRADQEGRVRFYDLGPGFEADALWLPLSTPMGPNKRNRPSWFSKDDFRLAMSAALNRRGFCDAVYLGACDPIFTPVTSGNARWFDPDVSAPGPDATLARSILAGIGLQDRNGDGLLDDNEGRTVRLTMLARKDPTAQRGAEFVRDELRKIGIGIDLVFLDAGVLDQRLQTGDYDAIYDRIVPRDTDPALNLDFWLSSGKSHVWNPSQSKPATDWERQIDEMMLKQAATADRVERLQLFVGVQKIFAQHMPVISLGAPHQYVATSPRVVNATPSRQRPALMWNAELLAAVRSR